MELKKGLSPEHPRAGSTDDVEGMFAFLHGMPGPIFDEKDFHDAFPKACPFTTTLDPMTDIMMVYFSPLMHHLAVGNSDWVMYVFPDELILGFLWQIEL